MVEFSAYRRKFRISPLTRRVLTINLVALAILLGGFLYLTQYRSSLIKAEIEALTIQAQMIANALGEASTERPSDGEVTLSTSTARDIMRRMTNPIRARARLFNLNGHVVIDTRVMGGPKGRYGGVVQMEELNIPPQNALMKLYEEIEKAFSRFNRLPRYRERAPANVQSYPEAREALEGEIASSLREDNKGRWVLSVAVPVQYYRQVLGALMLSTPGDELEETLRQVRFDVLRVSLLAFLITSLLSIYLANNLSRPIRLLAQAADRVRGARSRGARIPDFSRRKDEIGELSSALQEMTDTLWQRMDAIERFAADVAHEIKNPLNSLRSAVETASRVQDEASRQKLLDIIVQDVMRLDRLISDIAEASRVDAELSRQPLTMVDLTALCAGLEQAHQAGRGPGAAKLVFDIAPNLRLPAVEGRLAQVLRNLIDNALSFSPPEGVIAIAAWREAKNIIIEVRDQGPGIPEDRLEQIFSRFYTDRPDGEKFGEHSGLGLSIARQIVTAMGGKITAYNIKAADGKISGACFRIELPLEA
ncbi:MAG: stimulus-sensing domain-containing protein [Dongiaceae bacterium]